MSAHESPGRSVSPPPHARRRSRAHVAMACLNCGAALVGSFCSHCGQRAVPPNPTLRELVVTRSPNFPAGTADLPQPSARFFCIRTLTVEFLEGRRVRTSRRCGSTSRRVSCTSRCPRRRRTSARDDHRRRSGTVNGPNVTVSTGRKPTVLDRRGSTGARGVKRAGGAARVPCRAVR